MTVVYTGRLVEEAAPNPHTDDGRGRVLEVRRGDGSVERLPSRRVSGRDWFSWGTPQGGTWELAWAVAADLAGEDVTQPLAFELERFFAALDPEEEWELDENRLRGWMAEHRVAIAAAERGEDGD